MTNRIRSPYIVSFILIVIIFLTVRPDSPKYSLKPTEHLTVSGTADQYLFTYDLDNDGKSEFIRLKHSLVGDPAMVVYRNSTSSVGQWNFTGEIRPGYRFWGFGDYDANGFGEVYFITFNEGSLILNYIEPMRDRNAEADSLKICDFIPGTTIDDTFVTFNGMEDFDGDGLQELIITVRAGFSIYPRAAYIVNMASKEIKSYSNNFNVLYSSELMDLDEDGSPELFFNSSNTANMDVDLPPEENDNYLSAFVLDVNEPGRYHDLFRAFSPHGRMRVLPFRTQSDTLILGLACVEYSTSPIAYFWNKEGELQDSLVLEFDEYPDGWQPVFIKHKFNKELIIGSAKGYIYTIDQNKIPQRLAKIEKGMRYQKSLDINEDGIKEYIFVLDETSLVVYSENFSTKTIIEIPRIDPRQKQLQFSKYFYEGEPYLFVQNGSITKCYEFGRDWMLWGQYLFLLLGVISFWGFIFFAQDQQRIMYRKKQKAMDEMSKLQFQAIANQINPHFSYNILNTIGYSVLHEDRNKAYNLLVKYSTLTRNLIEGGIEHDRTIRQEIGFVETYLELQKSRFEENFNFYIDVDPLIDQDMVIPRMLILTFVENSIKHGLTFKEDNKVLKVSVFKLDCQVAIVVEDNGVGRGKIKKEANESAGQGLGILDRIIDIHRQLHEKDISYEIIDLEGTGETGTRVEVTLEC